MHDVRAEEVLSRYHVSRTEFDATTKSFTIVCFNVWALKAFESNPVGEENSLIFTRFVKTVPFYHFRLVYFYRWRYI